MLKRLQRNFLAKLKTHDLRQGNVVIVCLMLLGVTYCFLIGCAVEKGKVYEKDGKRYGEHNGLFKAKWYNYYLRGLSYGEGGFWEDAAADFAKAVGKRDKDQRRARTYGVHFIDYFPNRELGIANFKLGKFKEAMLFLEASIASVETARAKFYLNRARKSWLNETRLDTTKPAITVQFPPPVHRTNDFSISVQGTAHDDFFISNIIFNGKSSRLELSQRKVSFKKELLLDHGRNFITLQSEDILGKTSVPVTIQVKVDREGPLVFLKAQVKAGNTIRITGAVYDKSAIARILLHDKELVFKETQLVKVKEQLTAPMSVDAPILFEVEDIVGNSTTGSIQISSSKSPVKIPSINLKGLRDGQAMFFHTLSVEGAVRSNEGIHGLSINGQSLLSLGDDTAGRSFLKLLQKEKEVPLAFSKVIKLKEGENTIITTLADLTGEITEKTILITRKIPTVRQIAYRMTVAIFPFIETKKIEKGLKNYVYTFLTSAFKDQKRFNVRGRSELKRALKEQKLSRNTIFDQEAASQLSRFMKSETFLIGDMSVFDKSIEISARLVDTETSIILAEKDVYWEDGLSAGSKETLDDMALKFKQQLPLCEGIVINKKSDAVTFNLGERQSIRQGMRFLAFRECDPIFDPVTGVNLGRDTDILGLLCAKEIEHTSSKAYVIEKFKTKGIRVGDKVISK